MTAWAGVSLLLTLSQLLPSRAPWGGWAAPLPGEGEGGGSGSKPASFSLCLPPFPFPRAPFLPPGSWVVSEDCVGFPGLPRPRPARSHGALSPSPSLPSPGFSASGGFLVATQSGFPEPLAWLLRSFSLRSVVEGALLQLSKGGWRRQQPPPWAWLFPASVLWPSLPDRFCSGLC